MKAACVALLITLPAIAMAAPVAVSVDLNTNVHPFSPLIFGVAFGNATRNQQMGYTVDRWGGNSTTRYNWQTDVSNHASDYYFENISNCTAPSCVGTPPAGNSADAFIAAAFAAGAQPLMTITTIGWTPRTDSPINHPYFAGFSVTKYGAQQSVDPYDTDAGNGVHSNNTPITGNDPLDTSMVSTPGFEAQWIAHLQSTFNSNGGVKFYALDNEVMLWNSTHRDLHPNPAMYDEIWGKTVDYAGAIKQQDAAALVTGPVTWGYCDLFGSAADNCVDGSDRQAPAHGGLPFVAWYLQQVCANPMAGGKHLIDYLDLHYYPPDPNGSPTSIHSNADDATTRARRLKSLKELYDPNWISNSWIADLGDSDSNHYDKPNLIPRVHAWIDQYCPGTKLAITEYAWDKDATVSGAVAQAELLAIFAREGVDLATRWEAPAAGSMAEQGFQIFLNYDGAGARVQGDSVGATSADVDQIGAYAFRQYGQRNMVLLTNKSTGSQGVALAFNASQSGVWTLYGFDGTHALHQITNGNISGTALTLSSLPAMSANLLVLADSDGIFKDGFEPRP
jgi:hypothetical protein